jgi:putative FmdB family regulatory protein
MPTYEYECQTCHERVEAVQRFTDPALTTCELCGGELRKVFSAVGVVFKGSGFYKTDSRSADKSSKPSTTATAPAASSTESSATPAATTAPTSTSTASSTTTSD